MKTPTPEEYLKDCLFTLTADGVLVTPDAIKVMFKEYASLVVKEKLDQKGLIKEIMEDDQKDGIYSESQLKRLYDWLMDENREPANTKFTAGELRNLAREIEFRLKENNIDDLPLKDKLFKAIAGNCHSDEATEDAIKKILPILEEREREAFEAALRLFGNPDHEFNKKFIDQAYESYSTNKI